MRVSKRGVLLAAALVLALCLALCAALLVPEGYIVFEGNVIDLLDGEFPVVETLPGGQWINVPVFVHALTLLWGAAAIVWELTAKEVKLHRLTLVLLLLAGTMSVLCRPALEYYGWDEMTHRELVYIFSGYDRYSLSEYVMQLSTWFFGYMPYTLGVAVSNALHLPEAVILRTGSMVSVILYAVMASLAVKHTPRCKMTFMIFALMPTVLIQSSYFTYDGTVIAYLLLAVALLLEEMQTPDRRLGSGRSLALVALMVIGTIAKPAYSVFLLLLWMLPAGKFGGRKRQTVFRLFVLLMLAMCLFSMTLGTYDNVAHGDSRMDGANSAGQIAHILSDPGGFLNMLLTYLKVVGLSLFTAATASWAYLGASGDIATLLMWMFFIVCPLCSIGEQRPLSGLTARRRIWMGVLAWVPVLALIITQYIVSSPVGESVIVGMQPRYTLPVMVVLSLALAWPRDVRAKLAPLNRPLAFALLACSWCALYAFVADQVLRLYFGL